MIKNTISVEAGTLADPEAGDDVFTKLGRRLEIAAAALGVAQEIAKTNGLPVIEAHVAELTRQVKLLDDTIEAAIRCPGGD